jgi:hypothetical protein
MRTPSWHAKTMEVSPVTNQPAKYCAIGPLCWCKAFSLQGRCSILVRQRSLLPGWGLPAPARTPGTRFRVEIRCPQRPKAVEVSVTWPGGMAFLQSPRLSDGTRAQLQAACNELAIESTIDATTTSTAPTTSYEVATAAAAATATIAVPVPGSIEVRLTSLEAWACL